MDKPAAQLHDEGGQQSDAQVRHTRHSTAFRMQASLPTMQQYLFTMTHNDTAELQRLLLAAGQRDHASFAQVYSRTSAHLYGVALRMLGNEHAAQDVLQDAFVNIWNNASQYRAEVGGQQLSPMTWLIAIVRNKSLDALRTQTRRREEEFIAEGDEHDRAPTPLPDSAPSALEALSQASESLQIEGCMSALPAAQRQALALCYYQGLTHTEVAAQMGSPIGSVKAWVRRGLDKLKDCLARGNKAAGAASA
jgi:RNA polymerase sigma-70 factor, ECF subfamily